jgi:nicotinamidase-related amidase
MARCALLAMDFQQSILGFMPEPGPLLSTTRSAIDLVREAGGRVGYVRVAFRPEEVEAFPPHSAMGARVRASGSNMDADSPMTAIHGGIPPKSGDIVVRKTRVGAFSTTDLDLQLRNAGIDTLVLTGVHTSGVILTTVREAHDLDYRVIVLSDACADPDPEIHQFLVTRIFPKQATVCSAAALRAALTQWINPGASSPSGSRARRR